MRLIHTSDWHLGQSLHDFDRGWEHQIFLDWLVDTLEAEQADALLVAGDIYDNANPSAASQRQLYRFLTSARARVPHLNIVLIAGNHDSPGRLEAPAPFLELFDAAAVGQVRRLADGAVDFDKLVVPLKDAGGKVAAWCLAVPFLRPGDVPRIDGAVDAYLDGIARIYADAFRFAVSRRAPGQAIIGMGHCHMLGGTVSEHSERRIVIGGAEALPVSVFDPAIAYAALGHLHLAQVVGGATHVRYSGSPLPMSFTEIAYPHQVLCVDLQGEAVRDIRAIRIPRAVELLRVPAEPAPLAQALTALEALELPSVPENAQPYLQVRVLLDGPEPAIRHRVEAALEGKLVRLAKIESTSARRAAGEAPAAPVSLDDLGRLEPDDVFRQLYRGRYADEAPPPLLAAFAELMHEPAEDAAP